MPGLGNLIKIANAAQVSVQWLACGSSPIGAAAGEGRSLARMERLTAILEKAQARIGGKIPEKTMEDILQYAFFHDLDEIQTINLAAKWGAQPLDPLRADYDLLRLAARAVEELIAQMDARLSPEKKADVIAMVYENGLTAHGLEQRVVDRSLAKRLIDLAR